MTVNGIGGSMEGQSGTNIMGGMESAIMNGIATAMQQMSNNENQVIENNLYLDGEVVYSNQQKIKSSRGLDFGMGVFAR